MPNIPRRKITLIAKGMATPLVMVPLVLEDGVKARIEAECVTSSVAIVAFCVGVCSTKGVGVFVGESSDKVLARKEVKDRSMVLVTVGVIVGVVVGPGLGVLVGNGVGTLVELRPEFPGGAACVAADVGLGSVGRGVVSCIKGDKK
jgi:hypothetical protein